MANFNNGPPPEVLSSIMANNPEASAVIAGRISQAAAASSAAAAQAAASSASAAVALTQATTLTLDAGVSSSTSASASEGVSLTAVVTETNAAETSLQTTSSDLASSTASSSLTQTASSTTLATSTVPNPANSAASENASFQTSPSLTSLHGSSYPTTSDSAAALPPLSQAAHHNGLSPGAMAAAIIVPLLLLLAALVFAFILLRRRNRRNAQVGSAFHPAMKQVSHPPAGPPAGPIVTAAHNSAYYTGLDTSSSLRSSQGRGPSNEIPAPRLSNGGTTFYEPPPAYKKPSSLTSDPSPPSYDGRDLPRLSLPTENGAFDPFDDPASPTSLHSFMTGASQHLAPAAAAAPAVGLLSSPTSPRPGTSRSNTNVSITSDLYSDTASVHSARAARMSVGGAAQVIGADGSHFELGSMPGSGRERGGSDPFRDPVSPL